MARARTRRIGLAVVAAASVLAACGGGDGQPSNDAAFFPDGSIAVRANHDITVGRERLLVGVVQPDGSRLGSPDQPVTLEVRSVDDPDLAVQSIGAEFSWMVPDVVGLYRATFDFPRAGTWQVQVIPEVGPALEPALFSVLDPGCRLADAAERGLPLCALQVGDPAPAVASPTGSGDELAAITTDPEPDERLYRLSLDEAVGNGRPTVVVLATPAFCQTAACGPVLETVKAAVDDHSDVDFVHVEVYTGFREPGFDSADPTRLAPAVRAFKVLSEPWVFVVDADGRIAARFEGVMDESELTGAL